MNLWKLCDEHTFTFIDKRQVCIKCGLIEDIIQEPYIRSITHYKQICGASLGGAYPSGLTSSYISQDKLREQIYKFKIREHNKFIKKNQGSNPSYPSGGAYPSDDDKYSDKYSEKYMDYIRFLQQNQEQILPKKKNRKREITKIYGEHKKIIIDYITLLDEVLHNNKL